MNDKHEEEGFTSQGESLGNILIIDNSITVFMIFSQITITW